MTADYDDSTGWVVVGILTDPDASDDDLRDAVAMANPAEVREAQRRVRLLGGAHQARLDQVAQELREFKRRHPGIED